MQSGNSMQLSYWGFVETANDAMALIQPCSQGSLHFANRRPTASERPAVAQSGHIYIYEENPSTVQRWTDDQRWSRSGMLGDFLVYAELESTQMQSPRAEDGDRPRPGQTGEENWHRRLCGSLARSVKVTPQTLIKKTFSIKGSSATWRLVSYYRLIDVIEGAAAGTIGDPNLGSSSTTLMDSNSTGSFVRRRYSRRISKNARSLSAALCTDNRGSPRNLHDGAVFVSRRQRGFGVRFGRRIHVLVEYWARRGQFIDRCGEHV